jgi:hypothetical protein
MEFKVGDRVFVDEFGSGTIKYDDGSQDVRYLVKFDKKHKGLHSGHEGYVVPEITSWWCNAEELSKEVAKMEYKVGDKVEITGDEGYTTTGNLDECYLIVTRAEDGNVFGDLFYKKDDKPARIISSRHTGWRFSFNKIKLYKGDTMQFKDKVWAWDEDREKKTLRYFIAQVGDKFLVTGNPMEDQEDDGTLDSIEESYRDSEYVTSDLYFYDNVEKYGEPTVKEMTVAEIEEALGHKVKVIK